MEKCIRRWDGVDEGKPSLKIGWTSERTKSHWEQMGSHNQTKGRWNNREVQGTSSGKKLHLKGNRLQWDLLSSWKICLDSFILAIVAGLDLELHQM